MPNQWDTRPRCEAYAHNAGYPNLDALLRARQASRIPWTDVAKELRTKREIVVEWIHAIGMHDWYAVRKVSPYYWLEREQQEAEWVERKQQEME